MPSASSTSADPAWLEAERLPCLTTRAPAPAATIAAIVEMLTLIERSPPVPTTSSARPGIVRGVATWYIASSRPVTSSIVSPLLRRATAKPAIWAGVAAPASTSPIAQAVGCADPRMAPVMAGVFAARGVDAWVFRGDDGLDELTTTTTSSVWTVHDGEVGTTTVDPGALGLAPSTTDALRGGDATHNAEVVRRLLAGEQGAVRDAVLLNAGAALAVYDAPGDPVADALAAGLARATEAVDSGAAAATLDRWVAATSG